jgi:hypothetical protein
MKNLVEFMEDESLESLKERVNKWFAENHYTAKSATIEFRVARPSQWPFVVMIQYKTY